MTCTMRDTDLIPLENDLAISPLGEIFNFFVGDSRGSASCSLKVL